MAMTASFSHSLEFSVKAKSDVVFALLADVPNSAKHFPKVDQLIEVGKNRYRWEMEKMGIGKLSLTTVYACDYKSNKAKGTVIWSAIEGVGNAQVSGEWTIKAHKTGGALILFSTDVAQEVPVPRLMSSVVSPMVKSEFEQLIDGYVASLTKHFGGAV